jgi:hypothetical protein
MRPSGPAARSEALRLEPPPRRFPAFSPAASMDATHGLDRDSHPFAPFVALLRSRTHAAGRDAPLLTRHLHESGWIPRRTHPQRAARFAGCGSRATRVPCPPAADATA